MYLAAKPWAKHDSTSVAPNFPETQEVGGGGGNGESKFRMRSPDVERN